VDGLPPKSNFETLRPAIVSETANPAILNGMVFYRERIEQVFTIDDCFELAGVHATILPMRPSRRSELFDRDQFNFISAGHFSDNAVIRPLSPLFYNPLRNYGFDHRHAGYTCSDLRRACAPAGRRCASDRRCVHTSVTNEISAGYGSSTIQGRSFRASDKNEAMYTRPVAKFRLTSLSTCF
jgi:hypothetical protein